MTARPGAGEPLRVAVLGPGAVGGFLAAALARPRAQAGSPAPAVTVVAREASAASIAAHGISVRSVLIGDFTARPAAVAALERDVDTLIVATKAVTLAAALARVRVSPPLVVPLLNGLDHLAPLRERFGEAVAAATIRIGSERPQPGTIVQRGRAARIEIAAGPRGPLRPAVERLADALVAAAVPTVVRDDEAEVMWSKLTRLCALACTTTAFATTIGPIREDPEHRAALVRSVHETAAVAGAEGAPIESAAVLAEIDALGRDHGSSMAGDVAAGREPELDAIAGAVLRAADRHGLRCPTVAMLAQRIAARAGIDPPASYCFREGH